MEAQLKDFWTCEIVLSKEPFTKLALLCFICGSFHYTIQELRKHMKANHVEDDVEMTTNKTTQFKETSPAKNKYYFNGRKTEKLEVLDKDEYQSKPVTNGMDILLCEKCGLKFKYLHQLQDHVSITHNKIRQFLCSQCPKTYARKTHLSDHIRSHSLQRDFICTICAKSFRRSQELTRHKLLHQEIKNYRCLHCDATFRQHSGLYKHMRTKHVLESNRI